MQEKHRKADRESQRRRTERAREEGERLRSHREGAGGSSKAAKRPLYRNVWSPIRSLQSL